MDLRTGSDKALALLNRLISCSPLADWVTVICSTALLGSLIEMVTSGCPEVLLAVEEIATAGSPDFAVCLLKSFQADSDLYS